MLFKDQYFFLSNFYPCDIKLELNNKVFNFKNSEAAYQAQKNLMLADKFCLLSGCEAKKYGNQIPILTEDWNLNKLYAMAKVLNQKFKKTYLLIMLKLIKEDIVEDNYWGDTFWGVCTNKKYNNEGKNILGKMLMNIRDNNNDYDKLISYINKELIKYV